LRIWEHSLLKEASFDECTKNIKSHSKANGLIFSFFMVFSELFKKLNKLFKSIVLSIG